MSPGLRSDAGVGLLEVILVLAFGSILAALATPSVATARNGYELVTASANVEAKVAEARTNALKRNRNAWVLVTPATGTLLVQTAGAVNPVTLSEPERLPARVAIIAPTAQQQLMFDALGRPVDAAGMLTPHVIQVRHTQTNLVRTITVATTGRVQVN